MNIRYMASMISTAAALAACGDPQLSISAESATGGPVGQPSLCNWEQNFGNPEHTGLHCAALHGLQVGGVFRQDLDAKAQNAAAGFLQVHEGGVLTSADLIAYPTHAGANPDDRSGDTWGVNVERWGRLEKPVHVATIASTWRAVDAAVASFGYVTNGYVQQMPLAFSAGKLYVPQASARLAKVDPTTGAVLSTIDPFAGTPFSGDPRVTTAGGITVAAGGTLYYTAVAWPLGDVFLGEDVRGAWLVRVKATGTTIVPWAQIASAAVGVPQRNDGCNWPFGTLGGSSFPHSPDAVPPVAACGTQRPDMNAAVAIRPTDGHLIVSSGANNNIWSRYLIDIDPVSLQPVRAYATRERLLQGCGVRVPLVGSIDWGNACDAITAHGTVHLGFEPDFNLPGSFRGDGIMDGSPFCLPNGDCGISGYDSGFFGDGEYDARGAIELFHVDGTVAAINNDYGWEVTPSLDLDGNLRQDRVVLSALDSQAAIYSPAFELLAESAIPVDFDANAIDMLNTQPPVDDENRSYSVDGNGHLYQVDNAGNIVDFVALPDPDTGEPVLSMDGLSGYAAFDGYGHLFVTYAGNVYGIMSTGTQSVTPVARETVAALRQPSAALLASHAAKSSAIAKQSVPTPPTEVECDPTSGCTDGGGGGTCDRLCRTYSECSPCGFGYSCIGAGQGLVGACIHTGLVEDPPPSTCGINDPSPNCRP